LETSLFDNTLEMHAAVTFVRWTRMSDGIDRGLKITETISPGRLDTCKILNNSKVVLVNGFSLTDDCELI